MDRLFASFPAKRQRLQDSLVAPAALLNRVFGESRHLIQGEDRFLMFQTEKEKQR